MYSPTSRLPLNFSNFEAPRGRGQTQQMSDDQEGDFASAPSKEAPPSKDVKDSEVSCARAQTAREWLTRAAP